jgi:imidazolonepropionase-like amidohydrolase
MKRICVLMALLIAAPAFAQQAQKTTVYTNANVFDGTGTLLRTRAAVVTQGDSIVIVGPSGDSTLPSPNHARGFDEVVDLHGQYIIPGLIDSHVHMATRPNRRFAEALLRRDLYSGVTAVRDMAGDARALADLSRSARLGDIPSPDIYYAALMAGPQFFKDPRTHAAAQGVIAGDVPWLQAITDKTDLKIAVAEARGTGATGIKIYADLPGTLVRDITAEAHRQNILVWSHGAVFPASPADAIDGGVDVVSHVCMLAYQASRTMPPEYHNRAPVEADKFAGDNAVTGKLFADMKAHGTILDATLWVYEEMAKAHAAEPKSPAPYCSADLAAKLLNQAYRAGVMIAAGTDGFAPWQEPYVSLDDEVALLVRKAGMSPADAIRSATLVGAKTVGKANEMGTLEPGKLANFVVLAKNPLDDVSNLKTVTLTVKRGVRFRRAEYRPITADEARGDL